MDEGYQLHLANPSAIQRYKGLKHSDDTHDAFWLADMLRLGILGKVIGILTAHAVSRKATGKQP
jgi:hypothetical protein